MKRIPSIVLGLVAVLAFPSPVVVADGGGESLLERLSAETAALTAKADAQAAVLTSVEERFVGVLVGDPARFVVALDHDHGKVPPDGKVRLADGTEVDANLLDGDGELGLAVYALASKPGAGLIPAGAATLRRGALVVAAGGGEPSLHVLGDVGGPLDDVVLPRGTDIVALAPGGGLLGLRPWASVGSCTACHATNEPHVARLYALAARQQVGPSSPDRPAATVRLFADLAAKPNPQWTSRWIAYPGHFDGAHVWSGHEETAAVPGPVIERALADVADGGRFRRAYLGVVVDEDLTSRTISLVTPQTAVRRPWVGGLDLIGNVAEWQSRWPVAWEGTRWRGGSSVRLSSVLPESPAARAELKPGLEILEIDGRPFAGARGFARALARRRPGEEIRLTVKDWAEPARVVLADREKEGRNLVTAATVGLTVLALTPDLLTYLELPAGTQGVLVRSVEEGSAAAVTGVQRGDVILSEGPSGALIRDPAELDAILGSAKGSVFLTGRRGKGDVSFSITLPDRASPRKTR